MAWKVFADGVVVPGVTEVELLDAGHVIIHAGVLAGAKDVVVSPVQVDHIVAVWERDES